MSSQNNLTIPSNLRRIVTTHNDEGLATIQTDCLVPAEDVNVPGVEGIRTGRMWVTTDSVPTNDNNAMEDGAKRNIEGLGLAHPRGTNFQHTDLAPGAITPMHRTNSIDYNVLIQGELVLITDDGTETHLTSPGDAVIQKGTLHAWKNPSKSWTRWVTVLVAAEPAVVNGKPLVPAWQP